jgi:hypothetical protein
VLIKSDILRIRDREQQLLAKVQHSRNRLYLLDLKAGMPGGAAHRGAMAVAFTV